MGKIFVTFLSLVFLSFSVAGCTSSAIGSGHSLSGYKNVEVVPVSNETGRTFDFDITGEIAGNIISRLQQEGFNIERTSGNTLVIRSSLTSYGTQAAGTATCTVRSVLLDKKTGKVLVEIVASSSVVAGGLPNLGLKPGRAVLQMVADKIVARIEERMRVSR